MDFLDKEFLGKLGTTITTKGKEVTKAAHKAAEIVRLKAQVSSCNEVIKKNYAEIGRLYYEKHCNDEEMEFEKQFTAIANAKKGAQELSQRIQELKEDTAKQETEE